MPKTTRSGRSSSALTLTVRIDGARDYLAALNAFGRDANKVIRDKAGEIAETIARQVIVAGMVEGRQAAIVAPTTRVKRDRVPVVEVGGSKRIGRRRKPAYKLLFGSEFGGTELRQYKAHRGREGYWIFPTVERNEDRVERMWLDAADELLAELRAGAL